MSGTYTQHVSTHQGTGDGTRNGEGGPAPGGGLATVNEPPGFRMPPSPLEQAQRQRARLLPLIRIGFLVLLLTVTLLFILGPGPGASTQTEYWPLILSVSVGLAGIVVMIDVLTPNKKIAMLFSVFFGMIGSILGTLAIGFIIDLLVRTYDIRGADQVVVLIKVLIGIALAYLAIVTVLQTQDDFRLVIPYVEFAKQLRGTRPLVIDSSALIDGRIVEVAQSGLIQAPLVIPRFVLSEMQLLSDNPDRLKRTKGRRGLEVVQKLQRTPQIEVSIDQSPASGSGVDQMLVDLASRLRGMIVTTDSGLTRVAEIDGVAVLNVNTLASALRSPLSVGDQITLRLVRVGEQPGQGVGYLPDGTMVVAEDGAEAVGRDVVVTVISAIQTSAGRLVFSRLNIPVPPSLVPLPEAGPSATPGGTADTSRGETPTPLFAAGQHSTGQGGSSQGDQGNSSGTGATDGDDAPGPSGPLGPLSGGGAGKPPLPSRARSRMRNPRR